MHFFLFKSQKKGAVPVDRPSTAIERDGMNREFTISAFGRAPRRFRCCAEKRGGAAAVGEALGQAGKDRVCVLMRCAAVRVAGAACVRLERPGTRRGC